MTAEDILDLLSSLVDKSILMRTESTGTVRFRLLETLRDYGRARIRQTGDYPELRRRHADWYRRLMLNASDDWFSSRQVYWLERLEQERVNLWEALRFSLTDSPETALTIVGALHPFGIARGMLGETRRFLDRALAATPPEPTTDRIRALYGAAMIAGLQRDVPAAASYAAEALALIERMNDPVAQALTSMADGFTALVSGEPDRASTCFEAALGASDEPIVQMQAMLVGWALKFGGVIGRALIWQEKALAIAESTGEVVNRSYALWSIGVGWWRHGKPERAEQLMRECLQLTHLVNDPRSGSRAWRHWLGSPGLGTIRGGPSC